MPVSLLTFWQYRFLKVRWLGLLLSYSRWDFQTNRCRPHPVRGLELHSETCFWGLWKNSGKLACHVVNLNIAIEYWFLADTLNIALSHYEGESRFLPSSQVSGRIYRLNCTHNCKHLARDICSWIRLSIILLLLARTGPRAGPPVWAAGDKWRGGGGGGGQQQQRQAAPTQGDRHWIFHQVSQDGRFPIVFICLSLPWTS